MKNRQGFLSNKLNKYAIRKFTVGTASLLIGTTLVFGLNNEAKADELDSITTDKKTSGSDKGEALDIQDIKSMGENDTAKNDNEEKEIGDLEVKEGHRANSSEILSGENINTKHDDLIQEETTQSDIAHNRQKVSSQKNTKENSITEKSNQDIEQTNSDEQNVLLNEDKEEQVESKSDSENKTNTQPEKITKDTENPTQINLSENVTNKKNNEISNQEKVLKKDNDKDIKKEFLSSEGNHSESPKVDQEKMKLLKKDELLAGSSNEDINNEESKLAVLKTRANSVVSYKLDRSINEGTSEKINRLLGENLTATNTLKDGLDKIDQLYNNGLLADYEVETFKRSLLRRSSQFLNNKSQHDKWDNVINGGEDPDTKRELNKDVSGINQLFNDIKNLMNNRDTPNSHIKIVDDSGIRREDGKGNGMNTVSGSARVNNDGTVTAEFRLFRDWWDGEERYEVYAFRPSKEIADQIVKVTAKSAIKGNGKWESAFTEDKEIQINDLGYYALERPVSTSTNRSKGGSGGQVRFTVTFKGDKYIDPDIDWVQGYVLYDSKSPVITNNNAVGIFHENADITEIANEINPKVAENLVEKLENYYNESKQKYNDILKGVLITPNEQTEIKNFNDNITNLKKEANEIINKLPDNLKGNLPNRVLKINNFEVPEINDADGNGQVDTQDQADKAAIEDAIKEAQDAEQAAKDYVEGLNGVVSEASQEQVKNLNQAIEDAKAKAQGLIDQLPENTSGQADLQGQLDEVHEVEVPEINDADGNGQVDTQDQADKAAIEDAIK
ncbi:YSIRK-type signal peptide-containing protein, partial [Mammaliicoccus sp. A-M2]|uniref:GA-like domain-containing protein n=2 Tax=unclassified Mammaliicoccus TaxID=2803851 RepID=UPI001EFA9CBD